MNLSDKNQSVDFYEARFKNGYMDDWPGETKRRIYNLIKELHLPSKGYALDFGCGNGVLTDILRQALPSWKIYGTDISSTAVSNAQKRYPDCTFFDSGGEEHSEKKFDFIFTHHVLEHVFNLSETFSQMYGYLKPESSMLHVLPCGNEGSYEYNICLLRKDGINRELENRFFFEEAGHLRRLTSAQFTQLCESRQYTLKNEYYSNQYYGAINWITVKNPGFVFQFANPLKAVSEDARRKLFRERIRLMAINAFRLPSVIVSIIYGKRKKRLVDFLLLLISLPLWLFSFPVHYYWNRKSGQEWDLKKSSTNGSEMFLYYTKPNRTQPAPPL